MSLFWWGVVGGVLGEALKWYQLRESPNLPAYVRSLFYWGITAVMILIGGVLATLYGADITTPLLAVNVGISAPLILKALASTVPEGTQDGARGLETNPTLGNFLAGR